MKLNNFNKILEKIRGEIFKNINQEVGVDTGALKRSFYIKIENNEIIIDMLAYGKYSKVWKDNTVPIKRLSKIYNKYKKKLMKSYAKDVISSILNLGRKLK